MGCIFRFCTASFSFFHDGILFSFSLRSACSSNIGLNKKKSNSFQCIKAIFEDTIRRIEDQFSPLSLTSPIPLFLLQQLFSRLLALSSLFPVSQLSSIVEELNLLGSERPFLRKISSRPLHFCVVVVPQEGIRSCGGSTKPVHYIIMNQSGAYNFRISRVPAFYLPNMAF